MKKLFAKLFKKEEKEEKISQIYDIFGKEIHVGDIVSNTVEMKSYTNFYKIVEIGNDCFTMQKCINKNFPAWPEKNCPTEGQAIIKDAKFASNYNKKALYNCL